ncbi:hypothetical protein GCM10007906_19100 [Vibrio hyugaensis]|uniref:Uncharacterized protein n=1 Tax=Vibrio hyugaensis TaxID=1534743 RepID=A0ABQ5Y058_9VIBR|nr:hypothetical protein [Vibrio hyugaensis]GLR04323.1 hypothetical protein GCM10007906_19100 [Vibrio hyugaensis]
MNHYSRCSLVLLSGIAVVGFTVFSSSNTPNSPDVDQSTKEELFSKHSPQVILSDDVAFPSPVVQLQQTMAAGLVELADPSLELIRGDLQDFSDENVDETYQPPSELADLESRLEQLQQLHKSLKQ